MQVKPLLGQAEEVLKQIRKSSKVKHISAHRAQQSGHFHLQEKDLVLYPL